MNPKVTPTVFTAALSWDVGFKDTVHIFHSLWPQKQTNYFI